MRLVTISFSYYRTNDSYKQSPNDIDPVDAIQMMLNQWFWALLI